MAEITLTLYINGLVYNSPEKPHLEFYMSPSKELIRLCEEYDHELAISTDRPLRKYEPFLDTPRGRLSNAIHQDLIVYVSESKIISGKCDYSSEFKHFDCETDQLLSFEQVLPEHWVKTEHFFAFMILCVKGSMKITSTNSDNPLKMTLLPGQCMMIYPTFTGKGAAFYLGLEKDTLIYTVRMFPTPADDQIKETDQSV
jgi:hypothetical protein